MSVNDKILKSNSGKDIYLNFNIENEFSPLDNHDQIVTNFIDEEVNKTIPDIVDYEQFQIDQYINNDLIHRVDYQIFLNIGGAVVFPFLSQLGFSDDDIKFNRSVFSSSYLKLEFFDTPKIENQIKITESYIPLKLKEEDYTFNNLTLESITPVTNIKLIFTTYNPIYKTNLNNEGYFNYSSNKFIGNTLNPKYLYVRASFVSALTGITHKLCTRKSSSGIKMMRDSLHFRYKFYRDSTNKLFSEFDRGYTTNYGYKNINLSTNIVGSSDVNFIDNNNNGQLNIVLYEMTM